MTTTPSIYPIPKCGVVGHVYVAERIGQWGGLGQVVAREGAELQLY